ncbi:endoribonuclease YbeY isoform X2 [Amblyraja radiata]|uniref:endoribonuclease YbeY isoform X2 n=1 Tax=Amblyraja radiata TaxID=386614 RepID=UPI001402E6D9|nr:endoribonuclease YbeY isoform X2 [Amblyraja radiata]
MALVIRNLQRAVPLRRARLRRDCQVLSQILGLGHFDLGLICVDNQRMRILNGRYREQEAATDVLSFPFHQDLRPGDIPKLLHQDEYNLGDIFLGVEYIHKQSQVYGQDFYNVLTMFQREFNTLQMFNILTGASLKPLTQNIFSTHT